VNSLPLSRNAPSKKERRRVYSFSDHLSKREKGIFVKQVEEEKEKKLISDWGRAQGISCLLGKKKGMVFVGREQKREQASREQAAWNEAGVKADLFHC